MVRVLLQHGDGTDKEKGRDVSSAMNLNGVARELTCVCQSRI